MGGNSVTWKGTAKDAPKPRVRDVTVPGQAGARMIDELTKRLKQATPKPPKKK